MMSNMSFSDIGTRIQERILQLNHERSTLSEAKTELSYLQSTIQNESKQNANIRKKQLTVLSTRNEAELKILKIQEETKKLEECTLTLHKEARDMQEKTSQVMEQWKTTAEDEVICKHEVRRECYKRKVYNVLHWLKENRRKRQDALDDLSNKTDEAHKNATKLHKEREILRIDLRTLDEEEEVEDEELTALSMQIKSTLAKKASLRLALKDAQELHRHTNEKVQQLEQECMQHRL